MLEAKVHNLNVCITVPVRTSLPVCLDDFMVRYGMVSTIGEQKLKTKVAHTVDAFTGDMERDFGESIKADMTSDLAERIPRTFTAHKRMMDWADGAARCISCGVEQPPWDAEDYEPPVHLGMCFIAGLKDFVQHGEKNAPPS